MAVDNVTGEFVLPASSLGAGEAAQRTVDVLGHHGYSIAASGPNSFRAARTYRPSWATVLAIVLGVLLCGVGLFLLLVKRTDVVDITVTEQRDGVKVVVRGTVTSGALAALQIALGHRPQANTPAVPAGVAAPPPAVPVVAVTPPAQAPPSVSPRSQFPTQPGSVPASPPSGSSGWTGTTPGVARSGLPPVSGPATSSWFSSEAGVDDSVHNTVSRRPVQPSRPEAGLRLDDGRVVSVGTGVAIGRSPTPTTGLASVPIDDLSLSRTHASITPSDNGVWVTDLHSTNGVTIDLPTGTVGCVPGVRVEAPLGSRLHLGDVVVAVVAV